MSARGSRPSRCRGEAARAAHPDPAPGGPERWGVGGWGATAAAAAVAAAAALRAEAAASSAGAGLVPAAERQTEDAAAARA